MVGTGGHGHTYPGASLPFGMIQLSPDTRLTGWDGCGGYHDSDDEIHGFSHTHLSGTGIPDYCDILIMPTTKSIECFKQNADGKRAYRSKFDKSSELATTGYYEVKLKDPKVKARLTSGLRSAKHQYIFENSQNKNMALDLVHRDKVLSSTLEYVDKRTLRGSRQSEDWAKEQHVYFYMKFSQDINKITLHTGKELAEKQRINGSEILALLEFSTTASDTIDIQVAISAVDESGAEKNFLAEASSDNFDDTRVKAQEIWQSQLSKIRIKSNDQDLVRKFYTSLYHSCLAPSTYSDVDGRYRGLDQDIHQDVNDTRYTIYSLWDTYRSAHPLYTLIEAERVKEFCHDFYQMNIESSDMAMWELAANETYCMIGYHSVPVIVDAYFKGLFPDDPGQWLTPWPKPPD